MVEEVAAHYSGGGSLIDKIAERLRSAGKNLDELKAADLEAIDEFHFRELAIVWSMIFSIFSVTQRPN